MKARWPKSSAARPDLVVLVSLDVEEEGLFRKTYQASGNTLENVRYLKNLRPLLEDGVPITLFCAYSVLDSSLGREALEATGKAGKVEIGCHLHWWNTPPFQEDAPRIYSSVPSAMLPPELFDEKLRTLATAARNFLKTNATSFRMGRWDLHGWQAPYLAKNGFHQDASVRPYHKLADGGAGPDHFDSPINPYLIKTGFGDIYEYPFTATPLLPWLAKVNAWNLPDLAATLPKWGLLALLPVEHPLWAMKLAARAYAANNGRALSLTWHSSEMMPGGSPVLPTREKCERFLNKIRAFLEWLRNEFSVTFVTLSETPAVLPPLCLKNGDFQFGQ